MHTKKSNSCDIRDNFQKKKKKLVLLLYARYFNLLAVAAVRSPERGPTPTQHEENYILQSSIISIKNEDPRSDKHTIKVTIYTTVACIRVGGCGQFFPTGRISSSDIITDFSRSTRRSKKTFIKQKMDVQCVGGIIKNYIRYHTQSKSSPGIQ